MHLLGTWLRWILLSSLLFAAIGFAGDGEDEGQGPTPLPSGVELPKPPGGDGRRPPSPLPYEMPRRELLSPSDALATFQKDELDKLNAEQQKRLGEEIARIAQGLYTYEPGTMMLPPQSYVGDKVAKVELHASEVNPAEELRISRQNYESANGSARWTDELWDEFEQTGTITYPSRYPNLFHVFKVRVVFGLMTLQKGLQNIRFDFKKDIQSGIHEIVVTLPESIWAKNKFSARQTAVELFNSLTGIVKQITGSKQSVPAFSEEEAALLVKQLARANIVTREFERAAFRAFPGEANRYNPKRTQYLAQLNFDLFSAEVEWDNNVAPKARDEVLSSLNALRQEHGLSPQTQAALVEIGMEIRKREYLANALLQSENLNQMASSMGADMRLSDTALMEPVMARLTLIEQAHEKNWDKIKATVTSSVFSELFPRFRDDMAGLAQATVDEVQRRKQESFYSVILQDSGLDTCHPRAPGIGKLIVEHGRALQIIYQREQQFANSIYERKEEFRAQVIRNYPLRTFSEKFQEEKLAEALTQAYQLDRDARYEQVVSELRTLGFGNSAALLQATLEELKSFDSLRAAVQQETVPARAFSWSMDAMEPSEWTIRKVDQDGTFYGDPVFDQWVTTAQSFYRLRAWWRNTEQAYRALRQHLWRGQFINGPFGLRSWVNSQPFPYRQVVDPATGEIVVDETTVRPTWWSNMRSVVNWGNRTWNAERWRSIPGVVFRPAAATVAAAGTVAGVTLWTTARVVGTGVVGGTAIFVGSPLGAAVWAPLWATMASGLSHVFYDLHRVRSNSPGVREQAWKRFKWLSYGGVAAGAAYAGFDGYLDWGLETWGQLFSDSVVNTGLGLGSGMGIGALELLKARGIGVLFGKVVADVTYSVERLSAAVSIVPLRLLNAGRHFFFKAAAVRGAEYARDFVFRELFLNILLDKVFAVLGGDGVTVNDHFFMIPVRGPGVASEHFVGMNREQALISLWTTFEKMDLDHWVERRAAEALEPRAHFVSQAGMTQLAASGEIDVDNSPLGRQIVEAEKADEKFRNAFVSDRLKKLEPITKVLSTFEGRIRFSAANLATIRVDAAALAQRFFERMAHPDTTPEQRSRMWSSRGVKPGDWQALADRLLEETFGPGVLLSLEDADRSSHAEIESKGITELLDQVLAGEDLDTTNRIVVRTLPEQVRTATPSVPFVGAQGLCSTELRVAAERLPWLSASQAAK